MGVDRLASQGVLQVNSPGDNKPHWITLSEYNQTYWSGLDAAIYFNDLYIGEMVSLQYEIQESVYPLFPYSARTMEGAKHGTRRVFGQFTINYQQAILFWLILEHIRATTASGTFLRDPSRGAFSRIKINPTDPAYTAQTLLSRGILAPATATQLGEVITLTNNGQSHTRKLVDLSKSLEKGADASLKANADRLKEKFHWRSPGNKGTAPYGPGGSLLAAVRASLKLQNVQPLFDTPNGFTIYVRLGDQDPEDYLSGYSSDGDLGSGPQAYDESYLRALAAFDNGDVDQALSTLPPYTTESVTGIEVTGCGKVIDDSGRPILQTYSFLAKDVVPGNV